VLETPLLPVLEVLEIVAIAALTACTVWLGVRSLPQALIERQKRVESAVATFRTELETITGERAAWKAQGERLAEEVSTYLEQIERKRSSTAAAASRIAGAQATAAPPDINSMSRAEQIAYCRQTMGG
jgi:hypothetical protein